MNARDMDSSIVSAVHHWYSRHGIEPRFVPEVVDWLDPVGRPETDGDRQLDWLRATVSPVVNRLGEWYDRDDLIAWLFDGGERPQVRPIAELP
jgi:hypothetical protein